MAYLIEKDKNGRLIYLCESFLTSNEKEAYDKLLNELKTDIPGIENGLKKEYGNTVLYKYYLGKFLNDSLIKYNINESERRDFWDEIKDFASSEKRTRNEGLKSKTRSFFEQCFLLSKYDEKVVLKLSWRQWQSFFDRVLVREDNRIFTWIGEYNEKIRQDDWREFEKILNMYLLKIDTSVFRDNEIIDIYNELLSIAKFWRSNFAVFELNNPNSKKIKTKSKRSKKFYNLCLSLRKENKKLLEKEQLESAFNISLK